MPRAKSQRGHHIDGAQPCWAPLLWVVNHADVVGCFMWMGAIELADGRRLDAYKHFLTRRYLHLDRDGNTFAHLGERVPDRYRPCPPFEAFTDAAVRGRGADGFDERLARASAWARRALIEREEL